MTHTLHNTDLSVISQEDFTQLVQERLRQAVRLALIDILEEEMTAFIGAKPYERSAERQDQRNGHYTRDLETTVGLIADLPVPRTRGGHQTQVFERYHRRRQAGGWSDGGNVCERGEYCQSWPRRRDLNGFASQFIYSIAGFSHERRRNTSSGNSASSRSGTNMPSPMAPISP